MVGPAYIHCFFSGVCPFNLRSMSGPTTIQYSNFSIILMHFLHLSGRDADVCIKPSDGVRAGLPAELYHIVVPMYQQQKPGQAELPLGCQKWISGFWTDRSTVLHGQSLCVSYILRYISRISVAFVCSELKTIGKSHISLTSLDNDILADMHGGRTI